MAKLTTATRKGLPNSAFAGPGRTFPIENRSHAINAKARATQFASPKVKAEVDAKVASKFPGLGNAMKRMK
jgi:hypothetical protein